MPDEPPLLRQWKLMSLLSARQQGLTLREMAREMNVVEKTIRRDLDLFRQVGLPVEAATVSGDRGCKRWRIVGTRGQPPLTFNFQEAAALYLASQLLEPLAGTPFWESAQSALRRIRSMLGASASRYLDRFSQVFHCTTFGHGDYSSKGEVLEALTIGIEEHRATHITYRSQQATEPATRDVYPLKLVRNKGSLYLIAFAPEHDDIRNYKVDRIEAAEVSSIIHQVHRDFDVQAYLAGSLGIYDGDDDVTVVVKFLPAAARHASETNRHASQSETWHRDGSLTVRFRLSSTVEIKSWVLGYGAAAVVLEPASLRDEIAAELEDMMRAYSGLPLKM